MAEAARMDAVVIAGARNEGKLKEFSPEPYEATIPIAGKPLIRYTIDFLAGAKTIDKVVVVGPEAEITAALGGAKKLEFVPPTGDMFDNVLVGCERLKKIGGKSRLVLVAAADLPLITPEIVDGLVTMCVERGGEVFYPVASKETMEAKFPGTKRTYGTLKEGTFTGGNLFVVDPVVLAKVADRAKALIAGRKNALKMAGAIGFGFVVKLLLGQLTISGLETYLGKRFGFVARALIVPWAEIGIDIDKPADVELVEKYLAGQE